MINTSAADCKCLWPVTTGVANKLFVFRLVE